VLIIFIVFVIYRYFLGSQIYFFLPVLVCSTLSKPFPNVEPSRFPLACVSRCLLIHKQDIQEVHWRQLAIVSVRLFRSQIKDMWIAAYCA